MSLEPWKVSGNRLIQNRKGNSTWSPTDAEVAGVISSRKYVRTLREKGTCRVPYPGKYFLKWKAMCREASLKGKPDGYL